MHSFIAFHFKAFSIGLATLFEIHSFIAEEIKNIFRGRELKLNEISSAVVDTTFVDIYVDTKNIPTCRYNIQHIDKRTMEK